jgi:hypothetical protein
VPVRPTPSHLARALARALGNDLLILVTAGVTGYFLPDVLPSEPPRWISAISAMLTVVCTIPLLAWTGTSLLKLALLGRARPLTPAPDSTTESPSAEHAPLASIDDARQLMRAVTAADAARRAAATAWTLGLADGNPLREETRWEGSANGTAIFNLAPGIWLTAHINEHDPDAVTYHYNNNPRREHEKLRSAQHLLRLLEHAEHEGATATQEA